MDHLIDQGTNDSAMDKQLILGNGLHLDEQFGIISKIINLMTLGLLSF